MKGFESIRGEKMIKIPAKDGTPVCPLAEKEKGRFPHFRKRPYGYKEDNRQFTVSPVSAFQAFLSVT